MASPNALHAPDKQGHVGLGVSPWLPVDLPSYLRVVPVCGLLGAGSLGGGGRALETAMQRQGRGGLEIMVAGHRYCNFLSTPRSQESTPTHTCAPSLPVIG